MLANDNLCFGKEEISNDEFLNRRLKRQISKGG